MTSVLYALFGMISLLTVLLCLCYTFIIRKKGNRSASLLTSVQLLTVGTFIAVFLIFLPVYYISYDMGDNYSFARPVLLSLHNTLRIFILDGDFEIIRDSAKELPQTLRILYSLYAAVLYVAAPVLTFTNVLSLFKNIKDEFRFRLHRSRRHYIMSELNSQSIVLAKSIIDKARREGAKAPVIVFTDVYLSEEETDYELMLEANKINAICLRKDIATLDIASKKGDIELFLIGNDESENINQAVKITSALDKLNKKFNVKIFVFSKDTADGYIIDSLPYNNLMAHAKKNGFDDSTFKLRRINEIQQLAWATVPTMKVFDIAEKSNRTLSVLIAGMGSYGTEFFKTLVWYCQFEGYKLNLTIVDNQDIGANGICKSEAAIRRLCPDLMKTVNSEVNGESCYDIEFIPNVDMRLSDFDELLLYSGNDKNKTRISKRLKNTNLAIVCLGNDNLNIDVSVHLRSLFDRINRTKADKKTTYSDETVHIYSVLRDPVKAGILHHGTAKADRSFLVNAKEHPFNIHFIGDISSRFRYDNIYDRELEHQAYKYHTEWAGIEERIFDEWTAAGETEKLREHDWYFEYENSEEGKINSRAKYEKFEYYRTSSIAKALAKQEISSNDILKALTTCKKNGLQTCECENCIRRKRSEHMRWNAYVRTVGYAYQDGVRSDRAMLHDNLTGWDEVTPFDRIKD